MRRLLLWAALLAAGCGGSSTSPAPGTITEIFNGIVPALHSHTGDSTHLFTVGKDGTVTVTLTRTDPGAVRMVLEVGTRNGEECQWTASRATYAVASNTIGANNTSHLSLPLSASTYCVRLLDDGFLAEDLAYTIVVVHP